MALSKPVGKSAQIYSFPSFSHPPVEQARKVGRLPKSVANLRDFRSNRVANPKKFDVPSAIEGWQIYRNKALQLVQLAETEIVLLMRQKQQTKEPT